MVEREATEGEVKAKDRRRGSWYVALCDCGGRALCERQKLLRGQRKSCGCGRHDPRPHTACRRAPFALPARFGRLTAERLVGGPSVGAVGRRVDRAVYACLCDCGARCERTRACLEGQFDRPSRPRLEASCGCARRLSAPRNLYLYEGERLGLREIARRSGLGEATIRGRMKRGMGAEDAARAPMPEPLTVDVFGERLKMAEIAALASVARGTVDRRRREGRTGLGLIAANERPMCRAAGAP